MEFSFLLSSCLDIFEARSQHKTAELDLGLLQAVDERLAMYGCMTNTGIKFVIVVDMAGRVLADGSSNAAYGLRDTELKPVREICVSSVCTVEFMGYCMQDTNGLVGISCPSLWQLPQVAISPQCEKLHDRRPGM